MQSLIITGKPDWDHFLDFDLEQEWFTPGNLDLCPSRRSFSQGTMFNVDTDPV